MTFARWAAALALLATSALACTGDGSGGPPVGDRPEILAIEAPMPAIDGSLLRVTGRNLDAAGATPDLRLTADGASVVLHASGTADGSERLFPLDAASVTALGSGTVNAEAVLVGNGVESPAFELDFTVASSLAVTLAEAPSGSVHRNDVVVVRGGGFLATGEGTVQAHFIGDFMPMGGGATVRVDTRLPVLPAERFGRDRGLVRLTTALGGAEPGHFAGNLVLESQLRGGSASSSNRAAVTLDFGTPELFALSPSTFSLGQYVTVSGAGFLGGRDSPDEATLIRLNGTFTPQGGSPVPVTNGEFVPEWISGSEVRFVIETAVVDDQLVSMAFRSKRGVFEGEVNAIAISGRREIAGPPVRTRFTLGPVRQIVYVRFLPGYYESLSKFGLSVAASEIADGVRARMEGIYADYAIEIRLEEPDDFPQTAYAILEIGGPDPNGSGLFGYDNSPGKDVGNLRLADRIGGSNAEIQADGYPGYGGVFVESYLYWSSHPELPGRRPAGAPEPEPLFDELFDPVRATPVSGSELNGDGPPARVAVVRRAVDAFASIVGETAAHELGHSMGLAQPYGERTAYHNDFDGDGCLMDSGGSRPLEERIQDPSAARTQLCYDEPAYLNDILGR